MNDGKILAIGSPADLKARTNTQHIEDAFVALMPERAPGRTPEAENPAAPR